MHERKLNQQECNSAISLERNNCYLIIFPESLYKRGMSLGVEIETKD